MIERKLPKNSQIREGKIWPKPEGAADVREYRICRWSRDTQDKNIAPKARVY